LDRLTRLTEDSNHDCRPSVSIQRGQQHHAEIDGAGTHNYTPDTRDRLTTATHPNQTNESYTLDDVGNGTASHQGSSYSYQSFNRLVTANSSTFG
jgi:hypothetical protein